MTLYMAVTADKYELPLVVEPYITDLARKMGMRASTAYRELCRYKTGDKSINGKRRGYVLMEVNVEEDVNDSLD